MKTSTIFLLFFIFISNAHGKCDPDNVIIMHESGFSLSFGSKKSSTDYKDKSTVNVPLSIDGQQGCFKRENSFNMKAESKKGKEGKSKDDNAITITPMKTSFENIPMPHQEQYLYVEKNAVTALTKFHVLTFICSGEIPLSIEAISDSVAMIGLKSEAANVGTTMTFATGKAAENIKRANAYADYMASKETYEVFTKLYKDKAVKELQTDTPCCTTYNVPSILSNTTIKSLADAERSIVSKFTTMGEDVPNGCSRDFVESMKNFRLENYESNESLKDYKVKKKWFSDDLIFTW